MRDAFQYMTAVGAGWRLTAGFGLVRTTDAPAHSLAELVGFNVFDTAPWREKRRRRRTDPRYNYRKHGMGRPDEDAPAGPGERPQGARGPLGTVLHTYTPDSEGWTMNEYVEEYPKETATPGLLARAADVLFRAAKAWDGPTDIDPEELARELLLRDAAEATARQRPPGKHRTLAELLEHAAELLAQPTTGEGDGALLTEWQPAARAMAADLRRAAEMEGDRAHTPFPPHEPRGLAELAADLTSVRKTLEVVESLAGSDTADAVTPGLRAVTETVTAGAALLAVVELSYIRAYLGSALPELARFREEVVTLVELLAGGFGVTFNAERDDVIQPGGGTVPTWQGAADVYAVESVETDEEFEQRLEDEDAAGEARLDRMSPDELAELEREGLSGPGARLEITPDDPSQLSAAGEDALAAHRAAEAAEERAPVR